MINIVKKCTINNFGSDFDFELDLKLDFELKFELDFGLNEPFKNNNDNDEI